jgi:hypothetical protein
LESEVDSEFLKRLKANSEATKMLESAGEAIPGLISKFKYLTQGNIESDMVERLF